MMLWQLPRNLPFYLLFSSISLSTRALPVQSSELTPENFKSTIAKGVWFIEHFSPYCSHCRYFASTWEELVKENEAEENPGIHLRQINCVAHGDLCNDNGVSGYPQLQVYRDGELIEQFREAREKELLQKFMKKHARPEPDSEKVGEKKHEQKMAAEGKKEDKKVEEKKAVDKKSEANKVEHHPPAHPVNAKGQVLVLDPTNFHHAVGKGPIFIKFFAPWCGHCKKLAPVWTELAHHFKDKLEIAQVDCEAHSALCTSQGIQGFPTLVYFAGDSKQEYNGGRKLEQLKAFAEKASGAPVKAVSVEELKKQVEELDVVYALLHSSSQSGLVPALTPAFLPLLGSPPVLTVQDPPQSLLDLFNIKTSSDWHLVAIKDHDLDTPASVFSSHLSAETMTDPARRESVSKWLTANRLPTTAELTRDTFQSIMNAPSRPLVVIVSVTESNAFIAKEKIQEVARSWRLRSGGNGVAKGTRGERPVVFAWMDAEKWKDWMKSMYGVKAKKTNDLEEIDVVVADHQELIYYNTDLNGEKIRLTSTTSLFSAIEGVVNGKTPYLHSENFVERLARFLNKKVTAVEHYIVNNPMHTLFILAGVSGVIVLLIRRVIRDDAQQMSDYERKGGRLD